MMALLLKGLLVLIAAGLLACAGVAVHALVLLIRRPPLLLVYFIRYSRPTSMRWSD